VFLHSVTGDDPPPFFHVRSPPPHAFVLQDSFKICLVTVSSSSAISPSQPMTLSHYLIGNTSPSFLCPFVRKTKFTLHVFLSLPRKRDSIPTSYFPNLSFFFFTGPKEHSFVSAPLVNSSSASRKKTPPPTVNKLRNSQTPSLPTQIVILAPRFALIR